MYYRIDEFCGASGAEPGPYLQRKLFFDSSSQQNNEKSTTKLFIITKLMEHAAIQTLKTRDKVSLNKLTMQNLINITTKINDEKSSLSRIILEMLNKMTDIEDHFFTQLNPFLRKLLHSSNCDRSMTEKILSLMLKHSSEPVCQKVSCTVCLFEFGRSYVH